ncbi:MAG: hypothetical protein ACK5JD_00410 [Mangrovibacterium sp.]
MTPQVKSIIAHITPIGWVIALVVNSSNKDGMTSFYLRQNLGIFLIGIVGGIFTAVIPVVGKVIGLVCLVLWIISLIGAIQNKQTEIPVVGAYFQSWFKGL